MTLTDLVEKHKLFRRLALLWAMWLITVVVLRVTDPKVLPMVTMAVATVVTGVIGLLSVVIGFYLSTRAKEDSQ